jgi:putative transferase (TIGR04331 family)
LIRKKKYYLVTTADERTWPKDISKPVLFLGEWCKVYDRKKIWSQIDYEVVPYHWDDREALLKDNFYLRGIHEKILSELTTALNKIHSVNFSKKYWRILIGPWLYMFVEIVFDRWSMLGKAVKDYNIGKYIAVNKGTNDFIPNNTNYQPKRIMRASLLPIKKIVLSLLGILK